jgi:hypothetical protein
LIAPLAVMTPVERAVAKRFVELAVFEKKLVEVPFPTVRSPMLPFVLKRFVDEAVEANEFELVAFVEVELSAVKFCSVVDPEV